MYKLKRTWMRDNICLWLYPWQNNSSAVFGLCISETANLLGISHTAVFRVCKRTASWNPLSKSELRGERADWSELAGTQRMTLYIYGEEKNIWKQKQSNRQKYATYTICQTVRDSTKTVSSHIRFYLGQPRTKIWGETGIGWRTGKRTFLKAKALHGCMQCAAVTWLVV